MASVANSPSASEASNNALRGSNVKAMSERAQRAGLRRLSARANAEQQQRPSPKSSSSSSVSINSAAVVFSFARLGVELANHLRQCGIALGPGLSAQEFERIEAQLGFSFPPDVRGFLETSLPQGLGFPDWRSLPPALLRAWINLPASSVTAAVQTSSFWCSKAFGVARPSSPLAAASAAATAIRRHFPPPMVPLFGTFFVPSSPSRAGNPVFYFDLQGRIACCGGSLEEFIRRGFSLGGRERWCPQEECGSEEERRRWSTSDVLRSRSSSSGLEERSRSLPGRLLKPRVGGEDHHPDATVEVESWGRSIDVLAGTKPKKNSPLAPPPPPPLASEAPPWANKSSLLVIQNLSQSSTSSVGSLCRRIEFWSDIADKMELVHQQKRISVDPSPPLSSPSLHQLKEEEDEGEQEDDEDLVLSLSWCLSPHQQQQQHHYHSRAASISSPTPMDSPATLSLPTMDSPTTILTAATTMKEIGDDGRKWVSSVLSEAAARLRKGGWKEEEIVEMVDASSPRSVLEDQDDPEQYKAAQGSDDHHQFLHLVLDGQTLQRAGFTPEELRLVLTV